MRVLVLRALGLGDFCAGVPALRAVARACEGSDIVLAAPPPLAELLPLVGARVHLVPAQPLHPLHPALHGADLAVNLHGRGPQSTALLAATNPRELIAFGEPPVCLAWSDEHERERWCHLLRAHGIDADPDELDLDPPACARTVAGASIVHIGASSPARRWPRQRWARVVTALQARGHHVVLTGSEQERPAVARVAAEAGIPEARVVAGRTGLGALAGLVAGAALVVSGDTGIAHLAFAYRRPSVTLYGPTSPAIWGPPEHGPHVALWAGRVGDPHAESPDPGLLEITDADVLAAVARVEAAPLPT